MIKKIRARVEKALNKNKKLLIETVSTFFIRIFSAIISFVMNTIIGRYLGANESGYFFLALQVVTVLSTFCRLGSDNILLRYVSVHRSKKEWNYVQSVIMILLKRTIVISLIVSPILVFSSPYLASNYFKKPESASTLFWMGLCIPFYAAYMLVSYAFQAIRKVSFSIFIQGTFLPILLIICIIIFGVTHSKDLSIIYFLGSTLTALLCFILWKKKSEGHPVVYPQKKELIDETKPLRTIVILQPIMQLAGQLIAGRFVQSAALAQLAVAQRTSLLVSFILIAVNLVSAPRFAVFYNNQDMVGLKNYVKKISRLLYLVTIPTIAIVIIFAGFIMNLYGKDFGSGAILLRIYAAGQFINLITGSVAYLLMMTGHQKQLRNISLLNGLITLILILILTPRYGAIGSAVATSIGVASINLMAVRIVKRKLGINTLAI